MAVYGIGAMYAGTDDVSEQFLKHQVACLGFTEEQAPGLHAQLSKIKAGDVIFIKSYVPQTGLHIKAVGIVTGHHVCPVKDLGRGVGVRWAWSGRETLGKIEDYCDHMRRGSLYEEFNPDVVCRVIDLLVPPS